MSAAENKPVKSRNNAGRRIKSGVFLVLGFVLLYVPSVIHWALNDQVMTDIIRMGELEESVNATGYFIRNEQVLTSPFSGRCILNITEGEKVANGHSIAMVVNEDYDKLVKKLEEIDYEILRRKRELNEKEKFFSQDIVKIDNEIAERLSGLISEFNGNNFDKIAKYRQNIDGLIAKKAEITGAQGQNDPLLKSKMQERKNVEDQLNKNRQEIVTNKSGVISFVIDGYESQLNPKNIRNLTPEMLDSVKIPDNAARGAGIVDVEAGKPFAKLVSDVEYSIVIPLDAEKAKPYKVDSRVRVRLTENGKVLSGTVDYKSEEIDGRCLVAVTLNEALSETAGMRYANVDLIRKSYRGLKVPLKSLIKDPGDEETATIILVVANYTKFVKVRIIAEDGEFAIIDNIDDGSGLQNAVTADLYDTFVVNPENIEEGQLIE